MQQNNLVDLAQQLGLVVTAYSPFGTGGLELPPLTNHSVVQSIAEKHKKSPAQVLLRFSIQRGLAVAPKSENPERIKENIDVFNFELTEEDMNQLRSLDQHGKIRKSDFLGIKG